MAGTSAVFEARIQQRLSIEQRRAVLDALRDEIDPAHTVGEVFDAAEALGWGEPLGDLSLADLAAVLLSDDEATGDAEPEPVVRVSAAPEPAPTAKKTAAKKATAKKTAAKKTTAKKATAKTSVKKKAVKKKAAKKAPAKSLPTRGKRKPEVVVDERMSLDEAIAYFVPLLRRLGEATMQDLEAATGVGRRKLRFHIGQLVREGYLERHGMGRGTNYTIA